MSVSVCVSVCECVCESVCVRVCVSVCVSVCVYGMYACKSSPVTGLDRPRWFQEVKVLIFRDNGTGWW